jgi:hypothetical protein
MQKKSFIKKVFIISCILAIIYPVVNAYVIVPAFTRILVNNTQDEAMRTGQHLSRMFFRDHTVLTRKLVEERVSAEKAAHILKDFGLMKLKIFAPSGETLFSSSPGDLGKINKKSYFHDIVAKGEPYTKIVKKDGTSAEGQVVSVDVVETYVPLVYSGNFAGAFEIYYDITGRSQRLHHIVSRSSYIPLCIMLIFLFALLIVMLRGDKAVSEIHENVLQGKYLSPVSTLIFMTISIFVAESCVMLLLNALPELPVYEQMLAETACGDADAAHGLL